MKLKPSGLTAIGIALALASCAHNPASPRASVEHRFKNYDLNDDGKVTPAEYSEAATSIIFTAFDENDDGTVTLKEWQSLEGTESDAIYAKIDADGDGKVSLDQAQAHTRKTKAFANDFPGIDANKDGSVDLAEAKAYAAQRKAALR